MTDDLLDEATRLLSGDLLYTEENIDRTLRALVERVQRAEREAETQAGIAAIRTAERDDVARDGRLRLAAAERERDSLRFELDGARAVARKDNEHLIAERDAAREDCNKNANNVRRLTVELHEARGKLDQVRDWAHHIRTTRHRGDIEYNAAADVLAILDGKTGD